MKVFIAYATTEGQTRKISEWIRDRISLAGHDVSLFDCRRDAEPGDIAEHDLYILAGSLHMEKHQVELERFAQRHLATLQRSPSVFLSVSGCGSRSDEASKADAKRCIDDFVNRTGWTPGISLPVGGAIKYTQYNFILRAVMKRISAKNHGPTDTSRDHELTNYDALGKFVDQILAQPPKPATYQTPAAVISESPTGQAAPG